MNLAFRLIVPRLQDKMVKRNLLKLFTLQIRISFYSLQYQISFESMSLSAISKLTKISVP